MPWLRTTLLAQILGSPLDSIGSRSVSVQINKSNASSHLRARRSRASAPDMNSFLRASTCRRAIPLFRFANGPLRKSPLSFLCSRSGSFTLTSKRYVHTEVKLGSKPALASASSNTAPTVLQRTWVDKLPAKIRPYLYLMRIDKPIGTLLLFYPCGESARCSWTRCGI